MNDSSRKFMVSKFVCSACNSVLTLSYGEPKGDKRPHCAGEPTGADMVQSVMLIHPCEKCLEPARKVKEIMETLKNI